MSLRLLLGQPWFTMGTISGVPDASGVSSSGLEWMYIWLNGRADRGSSGTRGVELLS